MAAVVLHDGKKSIRNGKFEILVVVLRQGMTGLLQLKAANHRGQIE